MQLPNAPRRTFLASRSLIWIAGLVVPAAQRKAWRASMTRQVWHWSQFLAETGQLNRRNKLELARFCWGAFPAAFWVRYDRERFQVEKERLVRSPGACLGGIAALVLLLTLTAGIIPALHSFLTSPIPDPKGVCVINLIGKFRRVHSDTLLDLAAAWNNSKLVNYVAPYSWGPAKLLGEKRMVPVLAAQVAPEFFDVLRLNTSQGRVFHAADEHTCSACVLLSDDIWRLQFSRDPAIVGRTVVLDGGPREVIGVLPANFHLLSPEISVWTLLDAGTPPFTNFVERIGAVARIAPGADPRKIEADLADRTENAGYVIPASLLSVSSGATELRRYAMFYLLFVLLAVSCAAVIVYARSGTVGRAPLTVRDRLRWWLFFVTKSVMLLVLTGLLAWTTVRAGSVYLFGSIHPMTDGLALWVFLVLSLAPLSWAIRDQQRRCRVCLQLLGTPVPIGAPGHVLLDWSGTEMVCPEGHGVLYLPDTQANWLERDRWDNLDDSWAGLFKN